MKSYDDEPRRDAEMASLWQRIKFLYLGRKSIARWLIPLLGLTVVALVLRWATAPRGTVMQSDENFMFRHIDEDDIHTRLKELPDTRSDACRNTPYSGSDKEKVSIILDFNEHQFFDLRLTLESIIRFTPSDHFSEIVLLDDGTGDETVQRHAARYLSDKKFSILKAYRSEKSDGTALSRFKASKVATGTILVFLSSEVVLTKGWIEPLIDHVQRHRNSIAVPHADSILSGFRYFKIADNLVNVFNLKLTTLFYESQSTIVDNKLMTPVMTGHAFAVDKRYLEEIGDYDDGLTKGGGENLELSLRTWMCGGSIQIITCSRVGVRNALMPIEITEKRNFQRIAELWLDDTKRHAYGQRNHFFDPNDNDRMSLRTRQNFLKKQVKCMNFDDYMTKVAPMIVIPPRGARHYGKLRSGTGYCLTRQPEAGQMMKMVHCRTHMYEPELFFELDNLGRIARAGKCVELIFNGDVHFTTCEAKKADQFWEVSQSGQIESASKAKQCLTHYSEPKTPSTNYLAAVDCNPTERGQVWKFVKY